MSWFVQDKIAGAILYAIAAILATLILLGIALRHGADRESTNRLFREHWTDLFSFALIGIPSAAFGGLLIAGAPMLLLGYFGVTFGPEIRWGAVFVAALATYVWSLMYWFRETFLRPVVSPPDPIAFLGRSPPNEGL
jgi:hypothetical protein